MAGKAEEDGLSTWSLAIHMGDPAEVPGSWLQPGLAMAIMAIWGSDPTDGRSLFPFLSPSLSLLP